MVRNESNWNERAKAVEIVAVLVTLTTNLIGNHHQTRGTFDERLFDLLDSNVKLPVIQESRKNNILIRLRAQSDVNNPIFPEHLQKKIEKRPSPVNEKTRENEFTYALRPTQTELTELYQRFENDPNWGRTYGYGNLAPSDDESAVGTRAVMAYIPSPAKIAELLAQVRTHLRSDELSKILTPAQTVAIERYAQSNIGENSIAGQEDLGAIVQDAAVAVVSYEAALELAGRMTAKTQIIRESDFDLN